MSKRTQADGIQGITGQIDQELCLAACQTRIFDDNTV